MLDSLPTKLRNHASWLINAGAEDTKHSLSQMTGSEDDMSMLRAAIAQEKSKQAPRPSRLKPMEAKLRKFSEAARHDLLATKNAKPESTGPTESITAVIVPAPVAILGDASKALEKLRLVIGKHEESFHAQTLGPRLQIGLAALKAYQVFVIPDHAKRGALKGKKKLLTREELPEGGFKGWLATEAPWLKEPTAYKYMTAVRGLALDHTATEKQVAAALKLERRKGPVTLKSLCDAAVEAVGPPPPPPENLQQSEFQFLCEGIKDFREHAEQLLALKDQLQANPEMHRVVCARAYDVLFQLTGTNWAPSNEPDALALVDPDSITL
jgi:hypothetical protein